MIPALSFKNKRVALFGLGGSGLVTAKSLIAGGADVIAWDDNPEQVLKSGQEGIATGDLRDIDWKTIDSFVLAPGVPLTHPKPHWSVELAQKSGVEIIGDIEIFSRERAALAPDSAFIAITGTNGKSTTTALISHIIAENESNIQMGGNIGTAVLSLDPPKDDSVYVIECSSYQIDLAPSLKPSAGILLNLTPDHLDRHGTMAHYASVKERLVQKSDHAIVGVDDPYCQDIRQRLKQNNVPTTPISANNQLNDGLFLDESLIVRAANGQNSVVAELSGIETLRGQHNAQNVAAAIAACNTVGLSFEEIANSLSSFPGLKHRMQPVARLGELLFINDSKATNAEATAPALKSYEDIFWILGGLPKDGGITSLSPYFERVSKAFLIGEAAPKFAAEFGDIVDFEIANTLELAVEHSTHSAKVFAAQSGRKATILFSPACASFDQFRNFEIRGECFVDQVAKIKGVEMLIPHKLKGDVDG
ncbi:MAG: UDP-N-acetylmuramoyl-L-alanine--D-glutamate ligase [Lentilitoribacter sp.]